MVGRLQPIAVVADVSCLCCVRDDAYDAGDAAEGAEDGISMIRHPKP